MYRGQWRGEGGSGGGCFPHFQIAMKILLIMSRIMVACLYP